MARPWSARCYGVARQREGSRQNSIGGSGVLRRAFSPAFFGTGSLCPLARGCRRSRRGEGWFRRVRCCSTGSGRLDLDLLVSGPRVNPSPSPLARARALMARPWSARCYGVARQREGSRQNSIGGSGVLRRAFSPAFFGTGSLCPLARGCRRSRRGEGWFRRVRCCSTGSGRLDLDLLVSGPRVNPSPSPLARARALMARPWSARCYGVARQREGSRQNSIGGSGVLRRAFSPAFFGTGSLCPLARGCRRSRRGEGWFRRVRCCSTGSGRLDLDLLVSGPRVNPSPSPLARARALMARPWSARCYGVARQREGSRQNSIGGSGVLRRAFSPAFFGTGSLCPLARGCRRSRRGEGWFRRVRCCSTGSGRLDLDLLVSGPRVNPSPSPLARARALMARPWSARCYGVARQREGSRQNSIGGSRAPACFLSGIFRNWFALSLSAWVPTKPARRRMVSAGAMLLDRLGPAGFRFTGFRAPR